MFWFFKSFQSQNVILFLFFIIKYLYLFMLLAQAAITYSKLTIETLEQGVKYVQSQQ